MTGNLDYAKTNIPCTGNCFKCFFLSWWATAIGKRDTIDLKCLIPHLLRFSLDILFQNVRTQLNSKAQIIDRLLKMVLLPKYNQNKLSPLRMGNSKSY